MFKLSMQTFYKLDNNLSTVVLSYHLGHNIGGFIRPMN